MTAVGLGHVSRVGGEAGAEAPQVGCHPAVAVKDLDDPRGQPQVHGLAGQAVGHGVVVALGAQLDVVVDVHLRPPPGGELIARRRQRPQRRAVELLEQAGPAPGQALERPGVHPLGEAGDLDVGLGQAPKALVAHPGHDPALGQQYAGLDLGFVAGLVAARRDHGHAVVGGHVLVGGVDVGLIAVRAGHPRAQVVAHHDGRASPRGLEGVHVGAHPVEQLLGTNRLGVEEAARPEHGHEQLGLEGRLAGLVVIDRDAMPREVDEELLACLVVLAHDDVDATPPPPVELAELAVGVAVGEDLLVLDPQQHQGDVGAPELDVDPGPVRQRAGRRWRGGGGGEQERLEGVVVEAIGEGPGDPGRLGPAQMVAHGRERHLERRCGVAQAEAFAQAQSESISDLSHADMGPGHRRLLERSWSTVQVKTPGPSPHGGATWPPARVGVRKLRNRCTESTGTGVRKRPEPSALSGVRNREAGGHGSLTSRTRAPTLAHGATERSCAAMAVQPIHRVPHT